MASHKQDTPTPAPAQRRDQQDQSAGQIHTDKPTPDRTDTDTGHPEHIHTPAEDKPLPDMPEGTEPETNTILGHATRDTEETSAYETGQHVGIDHPAKTTPAPKR